ncbi:steroid 17-alpha-hydroxylase/17,20 lyase-like [Antedon mediterranea]|uniref:steroid 17-alpha-hydroxylase/17,20 lyase-like n=1 Tax=Antedon mediterranea TaxID=105859 RepID=UPI003AF5F91B
MDNLRLLIAFTMHSVYSVIDDVLLALVIVIVILDYMVAIELSELGTSDVRVYNYYVSSRSAGHSVAYHYFFLIALIVENPPWNMFRDMAFKYGPIFSVKFGSFWTVVINNHELAQETLMTKFNDFSGRPYTYNLKWFTDNGKDIVFAQPTPTWKFHRKLANSAIRKYATGDLETLVEEVIPKVRDVFADKAGTPFDPKEVITLAIYNIIASMCFGHDYNFKDPRLLRFIKLSEEMNAAFGNGALADFIPAARFLPSKRVNIFQKASREFLAMILTEVNEHLKTYSPDEPANDVIELLLKTQKDELETDSSASKLTDVHIKQIVSDLFIAGIETSTASLLWAVAYMIDNPDVQEKIKKELDDVIGDRPPRLSDRGKLLYTEAVIMETMRFGTVFPLSLPHCAIKDSTIGNYKVPESTWVFINTWALHNDSKYWDSPEKFKPERFMDSTCTVKQRFPSFLPFSTGRRGCVGQVLAKAQIFLIFTWLIQNYTFEKAPGVTGDTAISGKPQQLNVPRPYQTVAHPRS